MTDKLQLYNVQINKVLTSKDFASLLSIFSNNGFSPLELLVFYKRNKDIFKSQLFWNSQLPFFHLERIYESDLKVTFIQSYLSADNFCNHELNNHLFALAKYDFIKHIKLSQAFNHKLFYNSIKLLSVKDSELERIVKEFDIVIKAQNKITAAANEDENYFLQYSFGEVALAFSLYYYAFKQDDQVAGNKKWQTKIEMALVDELNNISSLFKGKPNMTFEYATNEDLQKQFQRNEAPHHILGKKGLILPLEPKFQFLFQLIERLIYRNSCKGGIQLYLSGFSEFQNVSLSHAPVQTNESYRTFKINDSKSMPEELYFSKLSGFSKTDITSSIEVLQFYGVPEKLLVNNNEIEIKKVLQLLKHFSVFKGPPERTFINSNSDFQLMNKADNSFLELFGPNESISLFEFDNLCMGISKYFKWNDEETKAILSFLTFDITSNSKPHSWLSRPFLKFNNQVLWLGSFFKDRRWENVILNKIKRDSEFKTTVKVLATNFEKKIEELFRINSFITSSSLPFKSSNGQVGDFDVLAFKDNCIIVCEAKTGIRTNDFIHAAKIELDRLEGSAAEQLEKAIFNIKEDWTNIKAKLGIDCSVELDTIKIIPLIVTDFFEGDLYLYKSSILKTSLLELDVIMNNKKKDLLESYLSLMTYMNSFNADKKQSSTLIKNWDLWRGKKEIEVETIIDCIEQNAIWKELETVWEFGDEKYKIDY
jgi:hypothetical protein